MSGQPWMTDEGGNPLVPPSVKDRLAQIDDRLSCAYYPVGNVFALLLRWPEGDDRWQYVQCGDLPESAAYETIGYVPVGIAIDEIAAYADREVVRAGARLENVAQVLRASALRNVQVKRDAIDTLKADAAHAVAGDAVSRIISAPRKKAPKAS
jgi:hypothetical protein